MTYMNRLQGIIYINSTAIKMLSKPSKKICKIMQNRIFTYHSSAFEKEKACVKQNRHPCKINKIMTSSGETV